MPRIITNCQTALRLLFLGDRAEDASAGRGEPIKSLFVEPHCGTELLLILKQLRHVDVHVTHGAVVPRELRHRPLAASKHTTERRLASSRVGWPPSAAHSVKPCVESVGPVCHTLGSAMCGVGWPRLPHTRFSHVWSRLAPSATHSVQPCVD